MKKATTSSNGKKSRPTRNEKLTIGLDLGDRHSEICVLNENGDIVLRDKVRTTAPAIERAFALFPASPVPMEVGTHSPWVSRKLNALGHTAIVANPRNVAWITQSRKKDDRPPRARRRADAVAPPASRRTCPPRPDHAAHPGGQPPCLLRGKAPTALTVVAEAGLDMSRFPDKGNFGSWLNLAPAHQVTLAPLPSRRWRVSLPESSIGCSNTEKRSWIAVRLNSKNGIDSDNSAPYSGKPKSSD